MNNYTSIFLALVISFRLSGSCCFGIAGAMPAGMSVCLSIYHLSACLSVVLYVCLSSKIDGGEGEEDGV